MRNYKFVMFILGIYLLFILSIGFILSLKDVLSNDNQGKYIDVPCYDKYGSEIKGLNCEYYQLNDEYANSIFMMALICTIGFCFLIFMSVNIKHFMFWDDD